MTRVASAPEDDVHAARFGWAMVLLVLAGAVDAAAFSHLGGLFVSFMSGNTTQAAVAAGGARWASTALIATALLAFVAGVTAGDLVAGHPPRQHGVVLLAEAALVALASRSGSGEGPLLALAMGMHNALAMRAERVGLALTYVTGTLVHLGRAIAARLRGAAQRPPEWPYAAMWCALAVGAVLGGLGARLGNGLEFDVIATALAITGVGAAAGRRWVRRTRP